jgi:hypothetical protein
MVEILKNEWARAGGDLATLFGIGAVGPLSDADLLAKSIKRDDAVSSEMAFAALVSRRGLGETGWGMAARDGSMLLHDIRSCNHERLRESPRRAAPPGGCGDREHGFAPGADGRAGRRPE